MQNTPPWGIIESLKNPILCRQWEILAAKPGLKTNFPSLRKWHLCIRHSSNKFRLSYHPLLYMRLLFLSIAKLFLFECLELFLNLSFVHTAVISRVNSSLEKQQQQQKPKTILIVEMWLERLIRLQIVHFPLIIGNTFHIN